MSWQRLNQYRLKRLNPEQQTGPLGLQCDRTKMPLSHRSTSEIGVNVEPVVVDLRGDETKLNL
jgi:hypothetical protein